MDFADEYPSADVLGTDLSPIQPSWVPPNCKFYVGDAESDWTYKANEAFDFIHRRGLGGSVADWRRFFEQVHTHLKPGGWWEIQDYECWIFSDDDTLNETGKATKQWVELLDEASIKFGKRLNVASQHKQRMIDAGFVDVQDDIYKVCVPLDENNQFLKQSWKCLFINCRFLLVPGPKIGSSKRSECTSVSKWSNASKHSLWPFLLAS